MTHLEVDERPLVGNLSRLRVVVVAGDFLEGGVRSVHHVPVNGEAGRVVAAELLSYARVTQKEVSRKIPGRDRRIFQTGTLQNS